MKGLLDTSIVVRYLTGDQPALADKAARIIDSETELLISDVVIVETAYVLVSVYGIPREAVVDHLMAFLQKKNINPIGIEKGLALQTLIMCRPSGRISFADAIVWAVAQSVGSEVVYSLDNRFPADGLKVRQEL